MNFKIPIIIFLILAIFTLGLSLLSFADDIGVISLEKVFNFQGDNLDMSPDEEEEERVIGGGFSESEGGESGGSGGESGSESECNLKSVQYSVSEVESFLECDPECTLTCSVNVKNLGEVQAEFDIVLKLLDPQYQLVEEREDSRIINPGESTSFVEIFEVPGEGYSCNYEAQTPTYCA